MIPYILAAIGGYLIGDSLKGKQYADGGMMADGGVATMSEKEFINKYFGANVFTEDVSKYFDIKNISSSNDAKIDKFIEDNKRDGYTIKKKSYSDFKSAMAVKKKMAGGSKTEKPVKENENYSDGGRISKGVKWKQEWTDTKGVEGYDLLEIEDTKYFSNNYRGGIVVRSRIIESSKPERVGNYQEDSKTELRKIFSGKYPFAYKYAEGGMMDVNYEKIKNYPTFETEEEAKKFIKIGKPFLRKELKEGKIVLLYNGKEYFLAYVKENGEGEKMALGKMAKGGGVKSYINRKGTYTGRIVSTQSGERMIGKISGYRGNGEPVYDVHNFGSLRKDMREKVGELSNSKIKELLKNKMAKGGQVYKLGDKWSPNFDYTGMLETALKAQVSWGMDKLRKLYDSFEDVNYHTANRSLWEALKSLKDNDVKAAEKHLENFRADVMEEMK